MNNQFFNTLKKSILDFVFPINCLNCGQEGPHLCSSCQKSIPFIDCFICPSCHSPSLYGATCIKCQHKTHLDGLISAVRYRHPLVQKIILNLKYNLVKDLSLILADLLIELLEQTNLSASLKPDLVLAVPLHRKKLIARGFNQSDLIAQHICQKFHWSFATKVVKKTKWTTSQTQLDKKERIESIKNSFIVFAPAAVKNKSIFLVDDVYTTGTTLEEIAKILKQAGARKVLGLTVARD